MAKGRRRRAAARELGRARGQVDRVAAVLALLRDRLARLEAAVRKGKR